MTRSTTNTMDTKNKHTVKIHEPRKILWSNLSDYIRFVIDIPGIYAETPEAKTDRQLFESIKQSKLDDIMRRIRSNINSYMYAYNNVVMFEVWDNNPDVVHFTDFSSKDISNAFTLLTPTGNIPNIVYGVDSYKNLVAKEYRKFFTTNETVTIRYLFRALKENITPRQYDNLVEYCTNDYLTQQDISRYTDAIGYRLV